MRTHVSQQFLEPQLYRVASIDFEVGELFEDVDGKSRMAVTFPPLS